MLIILISSTYIEFHQFPKFINAKLISQLLENIDGDHDMPASQRRINFSLSIYGALPWTRKQSYFRLQFG